MEEIPVAGFTADAVFPVIYAEGNAVIVFQMPRGENDAIASASAGEVVNMVPGLCTVELKGGSSDTSFGSIAHASTPEQGKNAISAAMEAVAGKLEESGKEDQFVTFYNDLIGWELGRNQAGLAFEDETGLTTVNAGLLFIDAGQAL